MWRQQGHGAAWLRLELQMRWVTTKSSAGMSPRTSPHGRLSTLKPRLHNARMTAAAQAASATANAIWSVSCNLRRLHGIMPLPPMHRVSARRCDNIIAPIPRALLRVNHPSSAALPAPRLRRGGWLRCQVPSDLVSNASEVLGKICYEPTPVLRLPRHSCRCIRCAGQVSRRADSGLRRDTATERQQMHSISLWHIHSLY